MTALDWSQKIVLAHRVCALSWFNDDWVLEPIAPLDCRVIATVDQRFFLTYLDESHNKSGTFSDGLLTATHIAFLFSIFLHTISKLQRNLSKAITVLLSILCPEYIQCRLFFNALEIRTQVILSSWPLPRLKAGICFHSVHAVTS